MIERKYENEAARLCAAIKKIAESESSIDNFENYLAIHFGAWLKKFAATPGGMAEEFEQFAEIQ